MGDSKLRRDSKDPMPTANYSQRDGFGGNEPGTKDEKHAAKKGERITASQNRSTGPEAMAVDQPKRNAGGKTTQQGVPQSGGNVPAMNQTEDHAQSKAERIKESQRW